MAKQTKQEAAPEKPKPVMSIADLVNTLSGLTETVNALENRIGSLVQQQNRIALAVEALVGAGKPKVEVDPAQMSLPVEAKKEAAVEVVAITPDLIRSEVLAYIAKHGRESMQKVLAKYGAAKATEIPAKKLPAFIEELRG